MLKKQKLFTTQQHKKKKNNNNLFEILSEELIFTILDFLEGDPPTKKSFSLVCKSFYFIESKHRRTLTPLRTDHLPAVFNRYPSVTDLDLTLCPRVTDKSLALVAAADGAVAAVARANNLEKLWLGRCKLVTDMGIGCVAVGCRKLRLICLKWCVGVGDLGVELVAIKCKELRTLDLSYLPITEKCLSSIFKLQHLEDLVLEGCYGIDDDSLDDDVFKQGSKTLKKLDISGCQNISHIGLSKLTSISGSIEQLILADGSPVTLVLADGLNKLSMLQSIILDGCLVTSSGLMAIGNLCISLKELSLSKCMGVTNEALSFLVSKHKDLRKLDITCCRKITDVSIASIANSCINLTSLRMESCTLVPREAFVLIGQKCHYLEELDLTDNEIDDEGLKSISRCSSLSSLKVGICLNITDRGLAYVGMYCSKLKELDLYRSTGITDLGIAAVCRGCLDLEMINTAYCTSITDSSLFSLSKCSNLKILEIRGCLLVTCIGLAAIAINCKQLSRLDIKKCYNIDDSGMIPLAHFSQNLRQINMSYSSVTDVGLLTLAGISCLQSFTMLHLQGLVPGGLASALLACRGLTKVKLHLSLRSQLPEPLIRHVEARGCVFEWRDKVFQAELDPKCWKMQLEDLMQ
ncbi:putative F-box domain, leucine-rich repeat domain, L domain-containing protein [Lupinus albus]|uniref:Putative F-box domain, leucine-rich repeat domain, L domain-containing protein n=1 Tax=Lupinus albus TaxID=3870 RepID=A0A6A4QB76_LUPAL|nr:putative F-box domain, leucine-rich repeat domain, L domain-containing protein [Lupinus albus]